MQLCGRHNGSKRSANAFLTAIIEEAIDETVGTPTAPPDPTEPIDAKGFLEGAAAFLRARPDAIDLLRLLQEIVAVETAAPPETQSPLSEPAPKNTSQIAAIGPVETPAMIVPETIPQCYSDNQ